MLNLKSKYKCNGTIKKVKYAGANLVFALICALFLFGCSQNDSADTKSRRDIDSLKNIPQKYHSILMKFQSKSPERIISIAPSTTELLFEYGAGEYLVGATIPHDYPPDAVDLPSIGDMSLDYERIIALEPDLIIGEGNLFAGMVENIKDLGIPVLLFDTHSFQELADDLLVLDKLFKRDISNELLDETKRILSEIPEPENKVKVAAIISSTPLILAAGDSWLNNLIRVAGGESITSDTPGDYITLSKEDMILLNPDVIIYTFDGIRNDLLQDKALSGIEAIKNDRIIKVDPDIVLRPTLRSLRIGAMTLRKLFLQS